MRAATAAQLAALQATEYTEHHRVDIQNADGTWINYRTAGGFDWLLGYTVSQNVDQPVFDIRVTLHRENRAGAGLYLAPMRVDSSLNVDDAGDYAPAVDAGRGIRVYTAVLPAGIAEPADGDWILLVEGEIDGVDSATPEMKVRARSAIGAKLADRHIEELTEYGTGGGVSIEDAIQAVIDDWVESPPTLYTPSSPGFNVNPGRFRGISVYEAIQSYAALIAYSIREKWDDSTSAFRLTFQEPDRTPASTVHTFSSDDYFDVQVLDIHRDRVRNALRVRWHDSAGTMFVTDWAEDAASIAHYGRKIYEIYERPGSPIDTEAEAEALRDGVLADLKDPTMDKRLVSRFFWPAELGDFYGFLANDIHYDTDQELAVTGFSHEVSIGQDGEDDVSNTVFFLTGKPVAFGAYWLKRRRPVENRPRGLDFVPPRVQVDWVRASSTTAQFDLTVSDPSLAVITGGLRFNKREGSESGDAFTGFNGLWDRGTGTPGTDTIITRGEDVLCEEGQESILRWEIDFTDENGETHTLAGVVSSGNLDEATKVVILDHLRIQKVIDPAIMGTPTGAIRAAQYLYQTPSSSTEFYRQSITLPIGVEIVNFRARCHAETPDDVVTARLRRVDTSDVAQDISALLTWTDEGPSWKDDAVSYVTLDEEAYQVEISLNNNNDSLATGLPLIPSINARFYRAEVEYVVPAYVNTL